MKTRERDWLINRKPVFSKDRKTQNDNQKDDMHSKNQHHYRDTLMSL